MNKNVMKAGLALTLFSLLSAGQAATIKIAVVAPLSGPLATAGSEVKNGADLALRARLNQFKKLGHTLQLVPFDDQATPGRAPGLAKNMIDDQEILGVVGPYNSGVANALMPVLNPANLALVTPSAQLTSLTAQNWQTFSRVVAPNNAEARAGATFINEELKPKSVFVISDNTTYGNDLSVAVQQDFKRLNVPMAGYVGASNDSQIAGAVKNVKASGTTVVYFGGTDDVGYKLVKALRAGGFKGTIVGSAGLDTPSFTQRAGADATGVIYSTIFGPIESFPNSVLFARNYKSAYKTSPTGVAAYSYDSTIIVLDAILASMKGNKLPSRAEVTAAMHKVEVKGCASDDMSCGNTTGALAFTNNGERLRSRVFMMSINKKLQAEVLKVQTINADPNGN